MQKHVQPFEDICEMPICATCNCKIQDNTSRVISIVDKLGSPIVLHYHYFFPCWDLDLFCQVYPYHKIISAGYICESKILQNQKQLRNMKNNMDLWD